MSTPTSPRPKALAGVALSLVAALTLAACGNDTEDQTTEVPENVVADAQQNNPEDEAALEDLEALYAEDASADEAVAGAGASRAATFGFTRQIVATDDEISQARSSAASRTQRMGLNQVTPGQCTAAVDAMDWSPMLISTDAVTRVDFSSDTFTGTGTIEVAGAGEDAEDTQLVADALENFEDALELLMTDCADLQLSVADPNTPAEAPTMIDYQFRAEQVDTEAGEALLWSRTPLDASGQAISALVLMGEANGQALMVSFAGDTSVHDEEFRQMAAEIMQAMTTAATPESDAAAE